MDIEEALRSPDKPRVLVEGGPVHRRVNIVLAILIGLLIGTIPVIGGSAFIALRTAQTQKSERAASLQRSCNQTLLLIEVLRKDDPRRLPAFQASYERCLRELRKARA